MKIQEGVIPTVLGTAVTATGTILKRKEIKPMMAAGMIGFGLAHVVLGAIDMMENRNDLY